MFWKFEGGGSLKLDKQFKGIIGSNFVNTRKDKTEVIQYLLTEFELKKKETVRIRDRKFNILGGKNNSLTSIGVTYGHRSIDELMGGQSDYLVDSFRELQLIFELKRT
ncbi:HAD hydrolase-like protein [Xanthovirga aplysinae]|uniref:HAD hydrolase-like protein n=1 Tax=Xanthovirga aplysinae TaxID=2529853 RepID=UPI001656B4F7|nr:hypothetical protein [Xanthovirga aplysinae]